jgi:hypothetical protein
MLTRVIDWLLTGQRKVDRGVTTRSR